MLALRSGGAGDSQGALPPPLLHTVTPRRLAHQTEGFRKSCLQGTLVSLATGRPCTKTLTARMRSAESGHPRESRSESGTGAACCAWCCGSPFAWSLTKPAPSFLAPAPSPPGPPSALRRRSGCRPCLAQPSPLSHRAGPCRCSGGGGGWRVRHGALALRAAACVARAHPAAVTLFAQQVPVHVTHPQQGEAAGHVEDALPAVPVQEQGAHGPRHQRPGKSERDDDPRLHPRSVRARARRVPRSPGGPVGRQPSGHPAVWRGTGPFMSQRSCFQGFKWAYDCGAHLLS